MSILTVEGTAIIEALEAGGSTTPLVPRNMPVPELGGLTAALQADVLVEDQTTMLDVDIEIGPEGALLEIDWSTGWVATFVGGQLDVAVFVIPASGPSYIWANAGASGVAGIGEPDSVRGLCVAPIPAGLAGQSATVRLVGSFSNFVDGHATIASVTSISAAGGLFVKLAQYPASALPGTRGVLIALA